VINQEQLSFDTPEESDEPGYTEEQQAIIDSDAPRIVVKALAGTGKTSTLVGYARAHPEKTLYIAYNKSVAVAAQRRFPPNVRAMTTHALAFPTHGKPFAHKLGTNRVGDIAEYVRLSFPQAALVAGTLNKFMTSADEQIGKQHLPPDTNRNDMMEVSAVLSGARTMWKRMNDEKDNEVLMPHDGYLRNYIMSEPRLPYPRVMMDEAQDINEITCRLVLQHRGPALIVGDQNQAIYQWRGARDALNDFPNAKVFSLTKSFRFGKGVAKVANHVLDYLGDPLRVVGAGQYTNTRMTVDRYAPYALVARTNMTIIQGAIQTLQHKLRSFYVGGVENIKLGLIEDGYLLFRNDRSRIKDKFIRKFTSLSALSDYARQAKDIEMSLLCQIVLTYTHDIPMLLREIRANAVDSIQDADRIFSTAHKAKGLEFSQVLLGDDFADLVERGKEIPIHEQDRQEVNLHYVAATRAIEALQVSTQLQEFLDGREGRSLFDRVRPLLSKVMGT